MRCKCNRCSYEWDEAGDAGAFLVQCPECFSSIPLNMARVRDETAAAEAPTVPAVHPRTAPAPVPADAPTAPPAPAALHAIRADDVLSPPVDWEGAATIVEPSPATETLVTEGGNGGGDSLFGGRDTLALDGEDTFLEDPSASTRPAAELSAASAVTEGVAGGESQPTRAFAMASAKEVDLTGQTVGGYRVSRMLGAGGMGAVCLARQTSLDRDVALKILPGRLAQNPEFLVRFTREALSAAQLCHHNIIQVYDVGSAGDIHYISMEFVRGDNLGNMVRREGALRVEDAASFVLQAARGLRYAHERGIIHRDIKPDNLMVNEHGIVKIADMGLAKMRGVAEQTIRTGDAIPSLLARAKGDLTMVDMAMGTPAYMPPEQARDASSVDHRADQYALGCTLYYLVAGEPPYRGSTAYEIISQHLESPTPALEKKARHVPGALSAVVQRMLAKDPEDRYPDMAAVIDDLEAVLGVEAEKGPYTPREHHLEILEREQLRFYNAPSLKWKKLAPAAFFIATPALAAACVFSGELGLAGGLLGLLVLTPAASFIIGGLRQRPYLFRRVRSVFFGMPIRDWLLVTATAGLMLALLAALGLILWWTGFAVLAAGLAAVYQIGIAGRVDAQRTAPLNAIQEMLKHLRLKGLPEDAIQDFVYRFSGEHWEEMFEALFGYEAMLEARARVAATDHLVKRKRYAVWREPIVRWLDGVEESRRIAREKRQLARVEARRLKAQGASAGDARRRARATAAKMHAELSSEIRPSRTAEAGSSARAASALLSPRARMAMDKAFRVFRFAAGALVLLLFASHLFSQVVPAGARPLLQQITSLPIPGPLRHMMLSFWGAGAGLALVISAFSVRRLTGALVLVGAAATLLVDYLEPVVVGSGLLDTPTQSLQASTAITLLGLAIAFFSRMSGRKF